MAKESGLGATIAVDESGGTARTISNDVTQWSIQTPRNTQDVTGVDKSAVETLLLLANSQVNLQGVFNDAANMGHAVLSTIPSTSVARTVSITVSGQVLAQEMNGTDYQLTRSPSGELTFQAPFVLADGTVPTWA